MTAVGQRFYPRKIWWAHGLTQYGLFVRKWRSGLQKQRYALEDLKRYSKSASRWTIVKVRFVRHLWKVRSSDGRFSNVKNCSQANLNDERQGDLVLEWDCVRVLVASSCTRSVKATQSTFLASYLVWALRLILIVNLWGELSGMMDQHGLKKAARA